MRKFYENWKILDANSSVATDDCKSPIAIVELQDSCEMNISDTFQIPDIKNFPVEEFFKLPFTHHIRIIESVDDTSERYYCFV